MHTLINISFIIHWNRQPLYSRFFFSLKSLCRNWRKVIYSSLKVSIFIYIWSVIIYADWGRWREICCTRGDGCPIPIMELRPNGCSCYSTTSRGTEILLYIKVYKNYEKLIGVTIFFSFKTPKSRNRLRNPFDEKMAHKNVEQNSLINVIF